MTVSELSKLGGVAPHVVRYYVRIGLLKPVRNPDNGYKLFNKRDISQLKFIRQAQSLGFTLEEVAEIFNESEQGKSPCHNVRKILEERISDNRERVEELLNLQRRMEKALKKWDDMPDRTPDGDSVCHLIESSGRA